jgi:serine/threonine protein phosphatase PrpC
MKVDTLLKRGHIHTEFCEDAVYHTAVSEQWMIGAVFDGCSSGKESYFASSLTKKLLKKACKTLPYLAKIQPELSIINQTAKYIGEFILSQVFSDLKTISNRYLLEEIELLSTLLLTVINKKEKQAWINVSGDGVICVNNKITTIDQHNMPDYVTYHLDKSFENWLSQHTKSYEFLNVQSLGISTDGINKFISHSGEFSNKMNTAEQLLIQETDGFNSLSNAFSQLTANHQLIPYDDIGIVRFLID